MNYTFGNYKNRRTFDSILFLGKGGGTFDLILFLGKGGSKRGNRQNQTKRKWGGRGKGEGGGAV